MALRENIRPLLKVTLSCRSRSRLTRTHWGADLDSTDRWSMEAWKESRLRLGIYYTTSHLRHLSVICVCFRDAKEVQECGTFLTRGLEAEALRLTTMAG